MLTTREVIKTFYNALLQRLKKHRGDWNQNDPSADDYIKNRPFYTDENDKTVNVPEQKIIIPSESLEAKLVLPELIEFVVGQTYEVKWDDKTYSCVAFDLNGISAIGNQVVLDDVTDTGEPFTMMISKARKMGIVMAIKPEANGTHTVKVTTTKVVKLDRKYIPDLGLAPVATSGNYYDLENAPTVYSDVVRYDASQSLSTTQKNQAKINIGAVSYDSPQSLTDTQKQQARTNIGAGTSNFNGDYNRLSNTPCKKETVTSVHGGIESKIVTFTETGSHVGSRYGYLEYQSAEKFVIGEMYRVVVDGNITDVQAKSEEYIGNRKIEVAGSVAPDNPEADFFIDYTSAIPRYSFYMSNPSAQTVTVSIYRLITVIEKLDQELIPSTIQRTGDPVILTDTNGAKWRLTVGTDGALTTEAVTSNTI